MAENDGGPAFPTAYYETEHGDRIWATGGLPGMSLRDWFAGMALQGLLMSDELARAAVNPSGRYTTAPEFAKAAHELADAMLAQRET